MDTPPKILIVDDEVKILELVKETLENKGYQTVTANNGDRALKIFEKDPPDLIITDIMIPRIDGFELVKRIRQYKNGKHLPIIMMSAVYRDLHIRDDFIKKYGVEYLLKPFSLVDLLKRINKFLHKEVATPQTAEMVREVDILAGKIDHFSVPILLLSIYSQEKTGLLDLIRGKKINKIYFLKGVPVFAEGRERKKDPEWVAQLLRGRCPLLRSNP